MGPPNSQRQTSNSFPHSAFRIPRFFRSPRSESRSCGYSHTWMTPVLWILNANDHVTPEPDDELHQPLGREIFQAPTAQGGYLGLIDPQPDGGLGLREALGINQGADFVRHLGL